MATSAAALDRRDDRQHPFLRRAYSGHQSGLDEFGPGKTPRPRDDTQATTQEVEVRSALTRCAMPGEPWSLNPYMGCAHDCVYCYVPDVAHLERRRWATYVIVKRNLPTVLAKELRQKEPRSVFLSSATDPYQPAEGRYEITRRCLPLLADSGWPVRVLTRSPLVLRDLELLAAMDDLRIGMSIPTLDDKARRALEPTAPPIEGRLKTIRRLADAGLQPSVNLAPAYPFTTHGPREIADAFAEAGAFEVIAAPWRYMKGVLPALRDRIHGSAYASFERAVQEPAYYDRMFRALEAAFKATGVRFRTMGERPPA